MMNFCCPQSSSQCMECIIGGSVMTLIFIEEPLKQRVMSSSLADLYYLVSSVHSHTKEAMGFGYLLGEDRTCRPDRSRTFIHLSSLFILNKMRIMQTGSFRISSK